MNFGAPVRLNKCGLAVIIGGGFLIILYAFGGGSPSENNETKFWSLGRFAGQSIFDHKKVSLRAMLVAAIDVAKRGGLEVVAVRNSPDLKETVKGKTKEGVKDSATEGDFRSHKVMFYGLRKAFPATKVISEEHTEAHGDLSDIPLPKTEDDEISKLLPIDETFVAEDITIWIDPLDATKEYTENLLHYVTTMVGVALKGKPIIGVIHRPFGDETYWAVAGYGNSPNLIKSSNNQEEEKHDAQLKIIVSRSHAGNVKNLTEKALGPNKQTEIISAAGAGYKVLEVVQGRADVYVHVTAIKKWDLCAGHAIINAMGGTMSTMKGEPIDYSWGTEPLNTNGILAYMKSTAEIQSLKSIYV